jgi:hypothetical protein
MNLWHLLLLWLFTRGGGSSSTPPGPNWPGPGVPPPTPPATPPVVTTTPPTTTTTPPADIPPTPPVVPATQTVWKPYFYVQPDAGAAYGTPYGLAGEWHGQGSAWTELYNYTKGRPINQTTGGTPQYVDPNPMSPVGKTAAGRAAAAKTAVTQAASSAFGTKSVSGSADYADVGDKLLVPWTWPEPSAPAIIARLQPMPDGTALPGVSGVNGDDDESTI